MEYNLVLSVDLNSENPIKLGKLGYFEPPKNNDEVKLIIQRDVLILTETLVTLIDLGDDKNLLNKSEILNLINNRLTMNINIRERLREILISEGYKNENYGCLMLNVKSDKELYDEIQKQIFTDDIYINPEDDSYGRQYHNELHVTVLYGLHDYVNVSEINNLLDLDNKPNLELLNVSFFENELYDVLKFDVKSDDLVKLNDQLKNLPYTNQYNEYNPHLTLCYLKKGKGKFYANKINNLLKDKSFKVIPEKFVYSIGDKKISYQNFSEKFQ